MNIKSKEKLQKKIQKDIHYCLNCQARDSGDWIWIMGEQYDLEQLFDDYKVDENLRDEISNNLYCPYCGTELNRYDEIGLEDKFDKEIRLHLDRAKKKYGKKIAELKNGIKHYPTLSQTFPLGMEIYKEIGNKKLPICTVGGTFYRARKVTKPDVLCSDDFLAPPIGLSQEGRFNHSGQSHFYIADSKETAISEIIHDENAVLIWLQQFNITSIPNILDLSFDWEKLGPSTSTLLVAIHNSQLLMQSNENKDLWKPDYNITRFIMDCTKYHGYNGIRYNSVRNSFGKNIVLFKCNKDMFSSYEKPEVVIHTNESDKNQFNKMIKAFEPDDIFE